MAGLAASKRIAHLHQGERGATSVEAAYYLLPGVRQPYWFPSVLRRHGWERRPQPSKLNSKLRHSSSHSSKMLSYMMMLPPRQIL
jgi:hypothetical protein